MMRSTAVAICVAGLSHLLLAGCARQAPTGPEPTEPVLAAPVRTEPAMTGLRNPSMAAQFGFIPATESAALVDGMTKTGAKPLDGMKFEYQFPPKETYTPEEIAAALTAWHKQITRIANARGTPIAANDGIRVELVYVSSTAQSGSGATVFIEPSPREARLFLDTPLPGVAPEPDGSVKLDGDGRFSANLPFSFIRATSRIYFHTVYRGSTRYFYYDTDRQTQEEVPVQNPKDWETFLRTGQSPAK